jgi:predicted branched-subunit amino acid permease
MVPLWAGVVPFGTAFAVLARTAGFSVLQTQSLSLFVFAGAAQVTVVTLTASGTSGVVIAATAILLNLRHALYSLSLSTMVGRRARPPRALLAYFLTDEAYGVTIRAYLEDRGSPAFLFGAGTSLYLSFNVATLAGALLGALLPDPHRIGLDFIFPLTFLALLIPLLRSRIHVVVMVLSGSSALAVSHFAPGGITILVSAVTAAAIGAVMQSRERPNDG